MAGMFRRLDLVVWSCLFVSIKSGTGKISPPQNLSVLWIRDFEPEFSWAPPQHSLGNCTYDVATMTSAEDSRETDEISAPPWQITKYIIMEGGSLQLSVETVCNGKHSKPAVLDIKYPDLVSNLDCHIQSSTESHCSWLPASSELSFFYRLVAEDLTMSVEDNSPLPPLQECSSYIYAGNNRTGCDLQANTSQAIHILFNGTVNNMPARNTFKKRFKDNVRPPPLNWTVTKTGDKFIITWIVPDIIKQSDWTFLINYTECDKIKRKSVSGKTSTHLDLVSACPYRMTIKAQGRGGATPWSDEKHFDADTDTLVYAAIIIPFLFAGLVALALVCCRQNKESIFPKIPEPRDLLSDIYNNNNKIPVCNVYVPPDEEDCKITLVMDPQSNHMCKN